MHAAFCKREVTRVSHKSSHGHKHGVNVRKSHRTQGHTTIVLKDDKDVTQGHCRYIQLWNNRWGLVSSVPYEYRQWVRRYITWPIPGNDCVRCFRKRLYWEFPIKNRGIGIDMIRNYCPAQKLEKSSGTVANPIKIPKIKDTQILIVNK